MKKIENCLSQRELYNEFSNNREEYDYLEKTKAIATISIGNEVDEKEAEQIYFNLKNYIGELKDYNPDIATEYNINFTTPVSKAK
jgi:hypothetical protein